MKIPDEYQSLIERHVRSLDWLRSEFLEMDSFAKPIMGIKDWDDSVCIEFGDKKLLVSVDGPYKKRLVMKSALIHASTDILVKGGKPLFAVDTVTGPLADIKEMIASLKKQSLGMHIPILGGNTMVDEGAEPKSNLTVVGELLTKEPIRDSGANKNDVLAVIGEPIWGEQDERIDKANVLFRTWFEILETKIKINAAKDVTKGGLISTIYEICEKSKVEFELEKGILFSMSRNLDNLLVSVSEEDYERIFKICKSNGCNFVKVGKIL